MSRYFRNVIQNLAAKPCSLWLDDTRLNTAHQPLSCLTSEVHVREPHPIQTVWLPCRGVAKCEECCEFLRGCGGYLRSICRQLATYHAKHASFQANSGCLWYGCEMDATWFLWCIWALVDGLEVGINISEFINNADPWKLGLDRYRGEVSNS